jgi:hypothetical protein
VLLLCVANAFEVGKGARMTESKANTPLGREPLRLENWPVERLIPSVHNARTHSPSQVAEIAGSIRTFGFSNPILVSPEGDIIAGHGRLAAARQLALAEVPVIVLTGLNDLQKRQLLLADNRIALNASWDIEALHLQLRDLSVLGADLGALGFTTQELARALSPPKSSGLTNEDHIADVADEAVTAPGDIWCAGEHRIACGSSTDPNAVALLLAGTTPHLMVTDPPYGVDYDPTWRHRAGVSQSGKRSKIRNDKQADWEPAWTLFPGNIAYVWHAALHAGTVAESLVRQGFTIRSQIIWAKERLVIGRGDYHWQHEPCWYAVREKGHWTGDRKQTTLWTISTGGQDAETPHSTQKPSNACGAPCKTIAGSVKRSTSRFLAAGPHSSRLKRSGGFVLDWSWSLASSTWRFGGGKRSLERTPSGCATGRRLRLLQRNAQ